MKEHITKKLIAAMIFSIAVGFAGIIGYDNGVSTVHAAELLTKTTTMECSVWSAPNTAEQYRVKKIPAGYNVTVYPEVVESTAGDGKTFYQTSKGCYILCKCFEEIVQENTAPESQSTIVAQMSTTTSTPTTIIGEGTYKVGTEIAPGEYVLMCNSSYSAYYSINKDSTGSLESIIHNGNFSYNAIVKVENGQYIELKRCTLSPISEMPLIDYTRGTMFKIGYQLPAGEYKLQANSRLGGYYAVLDDVTGSLYDISTNDNFHGQTYVTVQEGQYLELSRCTIVEKTN